MDNQPLEAQLPIEHNPGTPTSARKSSLSDQQGTLSPFLLSSSPRRNSTYRIKVAANSTTNIDAHSKSQEVLIQILKYEQRSDRDVWYLYDKFKDSKFFRQYLNNTDEQERINAILFICRRIKYESYNSQQIVIRQGEYSNGKVFIILSGDVTILNNKIHDNIDEIERPIETIQKQHPENESVLPVSSTLKQDVDHVRVVMNVVNSIKTSRSVRGSVAKKTILQASVNEELASSKLMNPSRILDQQVANIVPSLILDVPNLSPNPNSNPNPNPFSSPSPSPNSSTKIKKIGVATLAMQNALPKSGSYVPKDSMSEFGLVCTTLHKGDYFGEKALFQKHKRTATVIANTKLELLVLDRDSFQHLKQEFDRVKKETVDFLRSTIPNLSHVNSTQLIEGLLYVTDTQNFSYHRVLCSEGRSSQDMFLIWEGQCELIKTVIYDNSERIAQPIYALKSLYGLNKTKKEDVVVCTIEKGSFIGEEICWTDNSVYQYTIRVSSNQAKLVCFKKEGLMFRSPKIIIAGLKDVFASKHERAKKSLKEKLEKKGVAINLDDLDKVKPVVTVAKLPFNFNPNLQIFNFPPQKNGPIPSPREKPSVNLKDQPSTPLKEKTNSNKGFLIDNWRAVEDSKNNEKFTADQINSERVFTRSRHNRPTTVIIPSQTFRDPLLSPSSGLDYKNGFFAQSDPSPTSQTKFTFTKTAEINSRYEYLVNRYNTKYDHDKKTKDQKSAQFINNVANFKADFGKEDKDLEVKYRALKAKARDTTKIKSTNSGLTNPPANLADCLTLKMRPSNNDCEPLVEEKEKTPIMSTTFIRRNRSVEPGSYSPGKLTVVPFQRYDFDPEFIRLNTNRSKTIALTPKTNSVIETSFLPSDVYKAPTPSNTYKKLNSPIQFGTLSGSTMKQTGSNPQTDGPKQVVNIHLVKNQKEVKSPLTIRHVKAKSIRH